MLTWHTDSLRVELARREGRVGCVKEALKTAVSVAATQGVVNRTLFSGSSTACMGRG